MSELTHKGKTHKIIVNHALNFENLKEKWITI
jgi:hypothetical protein